MTQTVPLLRINLDAKMCVRWLGRNTHEFVFDDESKVTHEAVEVMRTQPDLIGTTEEAMA